MYNVHFEGSARGDIRVDTRWEAENLLLANVQHSRTIPEKDKPACEADVIRHGWVQYINGNKYFYGVIEEVK